MGTEKRQRKLTVRISEGDYRRLSLRIRGRYRSVSAFVSALTSGVVTGVLDALEPTDSVEVSEVDEMFAEYSEAEAPVYGLGRRRRGRREP